MIVDNDYKHLVVCRFLKTKYYYQIRSALPVTRTLNTGASPVIHHVYGADGHQLREKQESRVIARKPRDAACFFTPNDSLLFASAYEMSRPL